MTTQVITEVITLVIQTKLELQYSQKYKKGLQKNPMIQIDNKGGKMNKQTLIPLSKWNAYYDYPTVLALRQLVFYNKDKFVETVIRRIGNRMYIDTDAFFKWVEEKGV